MAQLLIRNLPAPVKEELRARARSHGRSMEAEARQILVDIVTPTASDPILMWLAEGEESRLAERGIDIELPTRGEAREVPPL